MKRLLVVLLGVALFAAPANASSLRLFFAPEGLTGDEQSAATRPPTVGNPTVDPTTEGPQTLYLWAQMSSDPDPQKWNGISVNVRVEGDIQITSYSAWNYIMFPGMFDQPRWSGVNLGSQPGVVDTTLEIEGMNMATVTPGVNYTGVANANGNNSGDFQYDEATNSTLIAKFVFDVASAGGGVYLQIGDGGISREDDGMGDQTVYFGTGDAGGANNDFGFESTEWDAYIVPEPAGLVLLALGALALRRR